jgi:hypothetical protein
MKYKYQFTPTDDGLVLEIVELKHVSPMLSQERVMFQTKILTSHEDVERGNCRFDRRHFHV